MADPRIKLAGSTCPLYNLKFWTLWSRFDSELVQTFFKGRFVYLKAEIDLHGAKCSLIVLFNTTFIQCSIYVELESDTNLTRVQPKSNIRFNLLQF